MSVYVDDSRIKYKGMIMCHMIADSHSELLKMADDLCLDKKYIQYEGTRKEHFDICKLFKNNAIRLGAIEIPKRDFVNMLKERDYQLYDY